MLLMHAKTQTANVMAINIIDITIINFICSSVNYTANILAIQRLYIMIFYNIK